MRRANGRPLKHIVQVAAGGTHSLALAEDGTIWSAGYNGSGQLGNGTVLDARGAGWAAPTIGTPFHGRVRSIGAGPGTSFAVDAAGVLWSWGFKYNGGLCLGMPYFDPDLETGFDPLNQISSPTAVTLGDGGPLFSLGRQPGCGCEDDDDDHRGRSEDGDDD
jgi:alpha-tubulin suppressor-like RCC1 family protein